MTTLYKSLTPIFDEQRETIERGVIYYSGMLGACEWSRAYAREVDSEEAFIKELEERIKYTSKNISAAPDNSFEYLLGKRTGYRYVLRELELDLWKKQREREESNE